MCASAIVLPWTVRLQSAARGRAAAAILPGVGVALLAVLAFGAVHAWLIVPIWSRLLGGVPFAVAAGIALAWAFDTIARARGWRSAADGARFGGVLFGTLLPSTALDAVMRLNGLRLGDTTAGLVAGVGLYALTGSAVGWLLARQRSAALASAAATLTLMVVSGGPLPITRSARGAGLSVAIAVIYIAAGALIARVRQMFRHDV